MRRPRRDGEVSQKSLLALVPRRELRRVIFLLLVLLAVLSFQRCARPFLVQTMDMLTPPPPKSLRVPPVVHMSPAAPAASTPAAPRRP